MPAYPAPYNAPPAPDPQDNRVVQELSLPIYQARGWLKFLGVLTLISGIFQALSIVGIIFAWLPIWMGILLYQAGSSINPAMQFGDKNAFLKSTGSIKTFFLLMGIISLLTLLLTAIMVCVAFVLPLLGVSLLPSMNTLIPYYYGTNY